MTEYVVRIASGRVMPKHRDPVEGIGTGVRHLEEQVVLINDMYNALQEMHLLTASDEEKIDALVRWLTEIGVQLPVHGVVVLIEKESV